MVLSITGPSVFIGDSATTGQIEFLSTDMDAVDDDGKPTGEKLLIARTPLINRDRNRINANLLARGLTHGLMVMHEDGTAYVVSRGTKSGFGRTPRTPVVEVGHNSSTVYSLEYDIQFVPDSSLILVDPNFAMHPAVNMTWYESASQAAALEDAHKAATGQEVRVRMMREPEVTRFVTWDDKYAEAEVIARAHLRREGVTGTASVVGKAAARRTTSEGFVDPFGNVLIWTDAANVGPAPDADMDAVTRIVRGASWNLPRRVPNVGLRFSFAPGIFGGSFGVRWVAVARTPL